MKCPLYFIGHTAVIKEGGAGIGECLEGECAWWLPEPELCAIPAIPRRMATLQFTIKEIIAKMPFPIDVNKEE